MPIKYSRMYFGKGKGRICVVHITKPNKTGFAGMVTSKMFNDNIAIIVDRSDPIQRDFDFSCLAFSKGGTVPRIMIQEDLFYDFKRGTDEARTILLHEIGHYANGDHGHEHYDDNRLETAQMGSVLEMEIRADFFAADYLGYDIVLCGLKALKKRILSFLSDESTSDAYQSTIAELAARTSLIEKKYIQ